MRFFTVALSLLIAMAFGVEVGRGNFLQENQAKKPEQKKVPPKESLAEKYNKEGAKIFKEMVFPENPDLKFAGKKGAEEEAKFLNLIEGSLAFYEKAVALHKSQNQEPPPSTAELKNSMVNLIGAKAKLLKSLQPFMEFRLGLDAPAIGYMLEWSKEKGQWTIKKVKRGSV